MNRREVLSAIPALLLPSVPTQAKQGVLAVPAPGPSGASFRGWVEVPVLKLDAPATFLRLIVPTPVLKKALPKLNSETTRVIEIVGERTIEAGGLTAWFDRDGWLWATCTLRADLRDKVVSGEMFVDPCSWGFTPSDAHVVGRSMYGSTVVEFGSMDAVLVTADYTSTFPIDRPQIKVL